MKRKNESDETGQGQRRPPAGNRGLLVAGLGAALAAVLSLGLLSAVSGSDSEQVTGAAQAPVAAAEAQPAAAKADYQVDIMGNKFGDGKQLVVEVGQTVPWTNHDSVPHTVTTTKAPVKFDSGTLEKGDSWSYTFTKAGTYEYYCAVHPDMTASVKVVEAGGGGGGGSTPAPTAAPTGTPTAGPAPTHAPTTAPTTGPAPTGGTGSGGSDG
ncbi:cupredoxin domain-containing protein, partial [Streptomyces sp. URMC 128]|uniref:cupredoxin domain-containing protein n=1 Tax=Streptomyces sp. URMC 128 TaxID=3423404 RepID=UPI003F1DE2D3